jgi:hypothetical protein
MTEVPNKVPYKVCVVVDREFGERLAEIESGVPVWIVDTPVNKPVAQRLWKERPHESHLTCITTFDDWNPVSPEDLLIGELHMIDLHHGSYSTDTPYTILEVFGAPLSERIKVELSEYGFNEFHPTAAGFSAVRPAPTA